MLLAYPVRTVVLGHILEGVVCVSVCVLGVGVGEFRLFSKELGGREVLGGSLMLQSLTAIVHSWL